ncbi:hypothetical protein ACK35P_14910 [Aeromonas veronii]
MVRVLLFLLFAVCSDYSHAVTLNINAEYSQPPGGYGDSEFRIIDPCVALPIAFSCDNNLSRIVSIDVDIPKTLATGSNRQWEWLFYHHFPGEKKFLMTDGKGRYLNMKFSFTFTGYSIDNPNYPVNTSVQADASSSCKLVESNLINTAPHTHTVLYAINSSSQKNGGFCYSRPFDGGGMSSYVTRINKIFFGYKLVPDGIGALPNGVYSGKLTLLVGSNKELDYTDMPNQQPASVDLIIKLVVRNQIKVIFPSGSNILSLEPDGRGWHSSREAPALSGFIPMQVISSVPISISLVCEYLMSDHCQLKNESNDKRMLLSVYRRNEDRETLIRPHSKKIFSLSASTSRDAILFKVDKKSVADIRNYPGIYRGNVTIIIDAAIEPVVN